MKITSMNSHPTFKSFWFLRFITLTFAQLMLLSCGGNGKGDATTGDGSSMRMSSSTSAISSPGVSSSVHNSQTSTSSSQSSIEYSTQFTNISITHANNGKLQINFSIQAEAIPENELLNCRWNPDTLNSAIATLTFPCNIRISITKEFDAPSEGAHIGELSVILPNKNIVRLNHPYEVADSPKDNLTDASNQFSSLVNENFYIFQNPSEPGVLRYLPKQLALSGLPGVASVQRTNKISNLLKVFLELSDSDWTSANQITFSSRFTLDVDLQRLRQESEAAGYTGLADLKVNPPGDDARATTCHFGTSGANSNSMQKLNTSYR